MRELVQGFIADRCLVDSGATIPNDELWQAFLGWQDASPSSPNPDESTRRRFQRALSLLGYPSRSHLRHGLTLRADEDEDGFGLEPPPPPDVDVYDAKGDPRPPGFLSTSIKRWWRYIVDRCELREHELRILTGACQAWDRHQRAEAILRAEGFTMIGGRGALVPRPEVAIARDALSQFASIVRQLRLEEFDFICDCPACEELQRDGHGYNGDHMESQGGLCAACDLAGCTADVARCLEEEG